ncbi:hypothetical protein ACG6P0_002657 [Enterococcus hirae]|uniref:Uncharacterized protein n=1 Tax=Enterococcus faecium TaxID=1352 RepID=A0A9X3XTG5_ENTFC|nr:MULTISPECIES: hypothetical protein [Enterococcus]EME8119401.1 hypothetical protein [Enterococcus faecium]EMF0045315.1 hypothetical protein [Enterococcus hirae]EMF0058012.1 hypothetical protein [Enterococcus hirae]EMF0113355.1 hypothetical protein [Enterococcus hirae]EMF0120721.1 hypothetical protein [Enterococcus hirae]
MNKVIKLYCKKKWFYHLAVFKIRFQYLFNKEKALQTYLLVINDIETNIEKYISIKLRR